VHIRREGEASRFVFVFLFFEEDGGVGLTKGGSYVFGGSAENGKSGSWHLKKKKKEEAVWSIQQGGDPPFATDQKDRLNVWNGITSLTPPRPSLKKRHIEK
jgi:hypothetical protein